MLLTLGKAIASARTSCVAARSPKGGRHEELPALGMWGAFRARCHRRRRVIPYVCDPAAFFQRGRLHPVHRPDRNGRLRAASNFLPATSSPARRARPSTRSFSPDDLPGNNTGNRSFLIATPGFAALGLVTPDYTMPAGFLFIGRRDRQLCRRRPADLHRIAHRRRHRPVQRRNDAAEPGDQFRRRDGVGDWRRPGRRRSPWSNITTRRSTTISSRRSPDEIALLDAHAPPFQDWSRTGFSFKAYVNAGAPTGSNAICRFFNDHFAPKSSHFYARARLRMRSHARPVPGLGARRRQALQHDAAGRRAPARPEPFPSTACTTTGWAGRPTTAS